MIRNVYVCTDNEGKYQSVHSTIEASLYHFREWNSYRDVIHENDPEDPDKINVYQDARLVGRIIIESI